MFREKLRRLPLFGQLFGQVSSPPIVITITAAPALSIGVNKTSGHPGDTFTFSGVYVDGGGAALPGYTVTLYKNGAFVGTSLTDVDGQWIVPWTATSVGSFSFYAEAPEPGTPQD